MLFNLQFLNALPVVNKLNSAGYPTYFVGGCVRDFYMNRLIRDIDLATAATPQEVQTIFEKVIPVGIDHGTVIVRHNHDSYEVTTFRSDGKYSDVEEANELEFSKSLHDDLQRRDFTMNALAVDESGNTIDYFNGKQAIENKLITTVGNSDERFQEDPLRIIRAIRFVSQLGFTIDSTTKIGMQELASTLTKVSVERLLSEFVKLIEGKYLSEAMQLMNKLDIFQHLPTFVSLQNIDTENLKELKPVNHFSAFIFYFSNSKIKPTFYQSWITDWKASNKIKKEAIQFQEALTYFKESKFKITNWLVYRLDRPLLKDFTTLISVLYKKELNLDDLYDIQINLPIRERNELAIDGHDLMQLYPDREQGRWLQSLLNQLEKKVVMKELSNTKSELKEWIKCNPPETN